MSLQAGSGAAASGTLNLLVGSGEMLSMDAEGILAVRFHVESVATGTTTLSITRGSRRAAFMLGGGTTTFVTTDIPDGYAFLVACVVGAGVPCIIMCANGANTCGAQLGGGSGVSLSAGSMRQLMVVDEAIYTTS